MFFFQRLRSKVMLKIFEYNLYDSSSDTIQF